MKVNFKDASGNLAYQDGFALDAPREFVLTQTIPATATTPERKKGRMETE